MAKVYVSSTRLDLEPERRAVIDWLVQADHQPRHSYVPDSYTVREGCLNDVRECDAYVLILGHRYGHVPQDHNPEGYSITELEYRCAVAADLPCVVLIPKGVRDIAVTDLGNPAVYARVQAFTASVHAAHKAGQFGNEAELIAALSAGLQKALRSDPLEDPAVQRVIARLTVQNAGNEDQILALQNELQQVKAQLADAVARTLENAAAPGASAAAVNAAQALRRGDTEPAEVLLRTQEMAAAQSAESEGDVATKQAERQRAATLARERGALALQHDVRSALAAYQQATEYEPEDVWNWYFLGDLYIATGDLAAAGHSYREAQRHSAAALEAQPDSEQRQRDLSVSHEKIGGVLVAQGDLPAALAAFRTDLDIAQALAARDPANAQWQVDVAVSCSKMGSCSALPREDRRVHLQRGLDILTRLHDAGHLPPNQDWRVWFTDCLDELADPPGDESAGTA